MPSLQNDSQRWARVAPEISYGNLPTYLITITQGGAGGTFTLAYGGGTASSGIAYNANAATVQTAGRALLASDGTTTPGTSLTVTGSAGALTITITGYLGAVPLVGNFGAITGGGTATLTGGPVWTVLKPSKITHKPKLSLETPDEIRNSMDMTYQDSVVAGGQIEDFTIDFRLRPDTFPLYGSLCGLDDTKTTVDTVYDHKQFPLTGGNGGKSYTIQMYDGQRCYTLSGAVGTDLNLKGEAGETGKYEGVVTGWSLKGQSVPVPTVSLPGNTSYRMLAPTNTGVNVTLNGSPNYAYLWKWDLKWKREAKPFFTQTGTVNPYRAQYGKRSAELTATILFDDPAEYDQALTVPPPNRSINFLLVGTELIGTVSHPQITVDIPRFFWKDAAIDMSGPSTVVALTGIAAYDTSSTYQLALTSRNEISTQY